MSVNHKLRVWAILVLVVLLLPLTAAARWISVDPHAGSYPSISPYAYCRDNPIKLIDPNGKDSYLFTWAPGGGQVGHSAIGTDVRDDQGKPTGKIQVRELWPATGVSKYNTTDKADYMSQTVDIADAASFWSGEGRGADAILKIKGDKGQDAAVNAALDQAEENPVYDLKTNNCSNFTQQGVQATGIDPGNGADVQINILGIKITVASNVVTPVSVNNAVATSGDERVTTVKELPQDQQNPNVIVK